MAYTVLATKYRPQTFDDLVGQEHVARTLGNAITSGRVAHAFLFTGVRGVGKTTTARLLAKCLNCEQGPTPKPCNTCDRCVDIAAGRDVDVQEIDGASNNGVDDVRRLQETLPYRPARGRYKIVIVDEVHMLSTGAFNAFLKTLEEPPEHVKFIFATTESHKVPVTIRSRCQRYDFRLIPQAVVAQRVRDLLARESITADDAAVALVAREAAGSMRDALTLLDQLLAFAGSTLEGDEVARVLGIAGRAHLRTAASSLLSGDGRALLEAVHALGVQGVDALHFAKQLVALLRDMVVLSVTGDQGDLVDMVDEERAWVLGLISEGDTLELQRCFAQVSRVVEDVAAAANPHTALEMGLLRVATRPPLRPLSELFARLEALDSRGPSTPSGGPQGAPSGGAPRGTGGPSESHGRPAGGPRGRANGTEAAVEEVVSLRSVGAPRPLAAAPEPIRPAPEPPRAPLRIPRSPAVMAALDLLQSGELDERPTSAPPPAPSVEPRRAAPAEAPREPVREASPAPFVVETPQLASEPPRAAPRALVRPALQEWERVVRHVRDGDPALAAFLEFAVPFRVNAERVVLRFPEGSFYGRRVDAPATREAIADAIEQLLGGRPEITVQFDAELGASEPTVAVLEAKRRDAESERRRRDALQHPIVQDALDVFPEARGKVEVRFETNEEVKG